MIDMREIALLSEALQTLEKGYAELPEFEQPLDVDALRDVLGEVALRMRENYPYFHPLYAGQMLKPPHAVARIAYMLSLWINPNNHALDGGIASSAMEKEAVAAIGDMFGLDKPLGHLCGGGTMANMEALWVAGKLRPGERILASTQAHYTHSRISEVLGLAFAPVPCDVDGRMDTEALRAILSDGNCGTVVATLGTTGVGAVDPLDEIAALAGEFGVRLHVDAAYGGYFTIAAEIDAAARRAYDAIPFADSVVIDPHKHGLQPYGCGCVLFRDPAVGALYKHDSPYTYFSSGDLHLGEISLECSRAGASAVALWATQKLLPMRRGGAMAGDLDRSLRAARAMHGRLAQSRAFRPLMTPQTDIVVYACDAEDAVAASEKAGAVFRRAASANLHLALIQLPVEVVAHYWPELEANCDTVICLRSCLMKPEHLDWVDTICDMLEASAAHH